MSGLLRFSLRLNVPNEVERPVHPKQIEAVLALSGPRRLEHLIKVVADREEAWGLYDDGWALAGTDAGQEAFLLWPAEEYAALCATDTWANYKPKAIPLDDLVGLLLPKLQARGTLIAAFLTPEVAGVTLEANHLLSMLEVELERY